MTLSLRIALSLSLLAGAGCSSPEDPAATPTHADVVAADSPASASADVVQATPDGETPVVVGQLLAISLEGNASTGYSWEIEADGAPQLVLAPSPDTHTDTPAAAGSGDAPPLVGAPSTTHWHFEAVQPGSTVVRLTYRRPWEKDVAPAKTAEFRVTVADAAPSP